MTARGRRRRLPRMYTRHGLTPLIKAVKSAGTAILDARTRPARALAQYRRELIEHLGGDATVPERTVIDLAARTKLLVDSIDEWWMRSLHEGGSLVNRRSRSVLRLILQRQQLADALARYMQMLGLERRQAPAVSLQEYLAAKNGQRVAPDATPGPTIATSEPSPTETGDTSADATSEEGA